MRCLLAQIKKRFLEWAASEPGVDVSPDVDLFHEFKEVRVVRVRSASKCKCTYYTYHIIATSTHHVPVAITRSCCKGKLRQALDYYSVRTGR